MCLNIMHMLYRSLLLVGSVGRVDHSVWGGRDLLASVFVV